MSGSLLIRAWEAALAAEQRAVFGYGLLGAHLHRSPHAPLARSCAQAHEDATDRSEAQLRRQGAVPSAPAADYPQLYPVTDQAQAIALAIRLEHDCAQAWRYLYAVAAAHATPHDVRTVAQSQLDGSAVRATRWRRIADPAHATVPFPGV